MTPSIVALSVVAVGYTIRRLTSRDLFLWGFLERIYGKKIKILEDFKRNTKQAVAGSVQQTLLMFPRYSVKWVNVFLEESGENF